MPRIGLWGILRNHDGDTVSGIVFKMSFLAVHRNAENRYVIPIPPINFARW
jgi:hypothetical protein